MLRENLRAGGEEPDPAVSLHFQCLAPALTSADVAAVYARERAAGRPVHYELVAAQPEALLVSLRRRPTWARHVEAGDGITLQLEPSFHSFVEVRDLDAWRSLTKEPARSGADPALGGVLSLRRPMREPEPRPIRH